MHKVSSTSALVLLLTNRTIYDGAAAKTFWNGLDLESGRSLTEEFIAVWETASEETNNRKFGVKYFCRKFLTVNPQSQVIFLGAGLDPKSLDIAETFPNTHIFDVDMDNMELKAKMTADIDGPSNITFCQTDISKADELLSTLKNNGWNAEQKTLVVAEGISYYIMKGPFKDALSILRFPGGGLILEYPAPDDEIFPLKTREVFQHCMAFLQKELGMSYPLQRYGKNEIQALANDLEAKEIITFGQYELEQRRKGRNVAFAEAGHGVISVSYLAF